MTTACLPWRSTALAALCLAATQACAETPGPETDPPDISEVVAEYCLSIRDAAAERRMATQTAALKELEAKVDDALARLEREKAAIEALIKRREELRNLARKELVEIYAGMDPEVASTQMEQLDVRLASSVLRQLKPRQASAILNEMNPELAAKIARLVASAAREDKDKP